MFRLRWALVVASCSVIAHCAAAQAGSAALVRAVGCIGLTVSDLDRSVAFYSGVLSFEKALQVEQHGEALERLQAVPGARTRTARLRLGGECLDLTEYLEPKGRDAPVDSRSNDRWFQHVAIVVSDMERAYAALRAAGVTSVSKGPQRLPDWNPAAAGIRAFYFRDPDRHALEVLQFPAGKGDAKWQRKGQLFLGIDHTAIVVSDTDASLRFYRDALGLRVAGTSENRGAEQERLNDVEGAHLRITTLRAASGPGIEFLEYLEPRGGRLFPADERANDLVHWQTTVLADPGESVRILRRHGSPLVSAGVVQIAEHRLGYGRAVLARDPDGHVLQLAGE
jgi:catechol 2,3-dioxygenase-like lactoylglutathione lyase family enzyme